MNDYMIKEVDGVKLRAGTPIKEPSLYEAQARAIAIKYFKNTSLEIEDDNGELLCYLEEDEWVYPNEENEQ